MSADWIKKRYWLEYFLYEKDIDLKPETFNFLICQAEEIQMILLFLNQGCKLAIESFTAVMHDAQNRFRG